MKRNILHPTRIIGILLFSLFSISGYSQMEIGLHGSGLLDNYKGHWGGGLYFKGFVTDYIALGLSARTFPKYLHAEEVTILSNRYTQNSGNMFVPVTGSVDFYLTPAPARFYFGSDIGVYYNTNYYKLDDVNGGRNLIDHTDTKTYFGLGPRAGFQLVSGYIGVFGQIQYNYLFGSGSAKNITVPGITSPVETNPTRSFASFDVGIIFRLGNKIDATEPTNP